MRSRSVGRKGGNRPDTPGHWRGRGCRERRREAGGADGGTEEGVGGGGPGGRAGGARTRRRAPSERWVWVRSGNGGTQNAVSAQGTTEDGRRRSEIVAAGGPRVEVKKGGWAWAAEGRHWRPSTRQENGPPAAEGRPWGRLNLRGGERASSCSHTTTLSIVIETERAVTLCVTADMALVTDRCDMAPSLDAYAHKPKLL